MVKVITLEKTKELLGITESTYDSAITSAIPFVDAAVKRIMRNRFNYQIAAEIENGSVYAELWAIRDNVRGYYVRYEDPQFFDDLEEYVETGQQISGEGIPADTYIEEVYYNGPVVEFGGKDYTRPTVKLSNAATENNQVAQIFLGINIGLQPIIAKAVWWKTLRVSTDIRDDSWISRKMGPVSVTKSEMDARVDGQYGMPLWLIKALPHYHGGH